MESAGGEIVWWVCFVWFGGLAMTYSTNIARCDSDWRLCSVSQDQTAKLPLRPIAEVRMFCLLQPGTHGIHLCIPLFNHSFSVVRNESIPILCRSSSSFPLPAAGRAAELRTAASRLF